MRISDWSSDVCSSDLQFARDRPAPPSAAPRSNARRSRFDERMTGQPLIDAFIRKYAETASIPQTILQTGAGTIDASPDSLLTTPTHQCRTGHTPPFHRTQAQRLHAQTAAGQRRTTSSPYYTHNTT